MTKVAEIVESISSLTLLEAAELKKAIEEKFGVSAAAPMMMAAPVGGAPAADAPAAKKTAFDVILTEAGPNKLQVVKAVKDITGLGLKESKDLVDGAPKTIKEAIPEDQAEEIKKKIEEAGGKVEIK
ncbi:MAG: 50S ribosomal protein L7/L12 [Candidatus Caenarcaniphilales bacterium]|nr:50S ribosomal protein L7/L12 [Candidatus Caenarcaniphilales bacterium]